QPSACASALPGLAALPTRRSADLRPVSYFYGSPGPGADGCPMDASDKCAREVLAIGTPLLWWVACFALLYVLWRWFFRRDWRARSEEHTSELQSRENLVCRLLLEK